MPAFFPVVMQTTEDQTGFQSQKSEKILGCFGISRTDRIAADQNTVDGLVISRIDIVTTISDQPFVDVSHLFRRRQPADLIQTEIILHHIINALTNPGDTLRRKGILQTDDRFVAVVFILVGEPEYIRIIPHDPTYRLTDIICRHGLIQWQHRNVVTYGRLYDVIDLIFHT